MVGSDAEDHYAFIAGDGDYTIEVISEIRHQQRLEWLAQGRGEEPAEYICAALLVHEPDNPFDPNAVSVSNDGVRVGYLAPAVAADMVAAMQTWGLDRATCDAIIEGGWYRSAEDKGDFCVRLDLNSDFAPESVPTVDRAPPPQPAVAAATAKARNTVYDLVLGAGATVAMLVVLGMVWLIVQPSADFGAAGSLTAALPPVQMPAPSPRGARDRAETAAVAGAPAKSARTSQTQATSAAARSDAQAPPTAAPSAADVSDPRPVVAAAEAMNDAMALPPPKPVAALPPAVGGAAVGGPPPASAETAFDGALPASADAGIDRAASIATVPLVVPEVDPLPHRSVSVAAAPVAQELDPGAAAAIFQSTLPPIPKPAPPQAAPNGDRASAPAAVAGRETPQARGAVAAAKRDARSGGNARTRRVLAKSRAAKAKSRYSARYNRKQRRTVRHRQEPAPAPTPMATQMIQGLAKEWSTQALPALRTRPRPSQ